MSIRAVAALLIIGVAILAFGAWQRFGTRAPSGSPPAATEPPGGGAGTPGSEVPMVESADPGVAWTVPTRWTSGPDRPMRVATYEIPAAAGDQAGAECAVFHFGPGQGGGVDDNIERWISQFSSPGKPNRSSKQIHGFEVSRVEVTGTYLAPSGPMMQSQGQFPDYMLIGAIVAGPNGSVFFKLTGPKKTVQAVARDFDAMLESLHEK